MARQPKAKPQGQPRELVRRTTAMTDALVSACSQAGIDVSGVRLPLKREPTWRVSRKA